MMNPSEMFERKEEAMTVSQREPEETLAARGNNIPKGLMRIAPSRS
jgi:hypothetical protein